MMHIAHKFKGYEKYTDKIGLKIYISTTYKTPYNLILVKVDQGKCN